MRQVTFIAIASFVLFIACQNSERYEADIKQFIPGTYVKEVKNEYTIAYDTLIIQCAAGNNFLIVNRTAFQPIRNNRLQSVRYTEVNMKALYDEPSQNLYEQRLGKTFSFDPSTKRLFEGASQYSKINP